MSPSQIMKPSGFPLHSSTKQRHNWTISDVPCDLLVQVAGVNFALHKYPLVSKCGLLRMLVMQEAQERQCEPLKLELQGVPGDAGGFEIAAKFCYGISPEISPTNVVLLRCLAEFLDMSENQGEENLMSLTENYINKLRCHTFRDIVRTLHSCEALLPLSEDLKIVSRCIELVVFMVLKEQDGSEKRSIIALHDIKTTGNNHVEWWMEELSILRIDFYQRVIAAMGLRPEVVGNALVHYVQKHLNIFVEQITDNLINMDKTLICDSKLVLEHEQRIIVETVVNHLPREKHLFSTAFLVRLLRTARSLETTLACQLDIERRISMQLHRATVNDILLPSSCNDTLFDIDIIHRIIACFLEQQQCEDGYEEDASDDSCGFSYPYQKPLIQVGMLLDGYLSELATDPNLGLSKFITLAELLPNDARPNQDGLYRAIDVYLKAHSNLTDVEKKKLCKILDFQKLSREACTHATQNERLPVQVVVQVLYIEQLRIRNVMATSGGDMAHDLTSHVHSRLMGAGSLSPNDKVDHYASIRRENRELKLEVARMRTRLSDLEKDHNNIKHGIEKGVSLPHHEHHHHGFFHAFAKSISKLNPFHHHKLNPTSNFQPSHSQVHDHASLSHSQKQGWTHSISSSSSQASLEMPKKDIRRKRYSLS